VAKFTLITIAFAAAILVGTAAPRAHGSDADPSRIYSEPQQLVEVAPARRINVVCTGEGSPTVVLSAGGLSWSIVWSRVQPIVARSTRVCAWDRAGNGYSDPSAEPQDITHTEADLEQALAGAGISGPLVLVAHSVGALETLLFADRHPERVVGMVLVDPSFPDQRRRLVEAGPAVMAFSDQSDAAYFAVVERCIAGLERSQLAPSACRALRAGLPGPVRKGLASLGSDPAYWRTYLADRDVRDRSAILAINPSRSYGAMPLIVLGAGRLNLPGAPAQAQQQLPAIRAEIERGQRELAALSSRGEYVQVPGAAHAIQVERPDAVTSAVDEVLKQTRQ